MPASLFYKKNHDLWVSNSSKDWFCEIMAKSSLKKGKDISLIFEEEPAVAGCYGISGLGIDMECFFKNFGGYQEFLDHLEYCKNNVSNLCEEGQSENSLFNLLAWAQHILTGGRIAEDIQIYDSLPK
jgi:hypothetical protein